MPEPLTMPGLPQVKPEEKTRRIPPYNVVLLDDDRDERHGVTSAGPEPPGESGVF